MKILMIRFSALGDVAMLAPVVKEVVTALPEAEVTVLSRPFCAPLFEGLGDRVHFLGADIKGEYKGVGGLSRLFARLKEERYDYVADMHGVLRTHYLSMRFRMAGYKVAKIDKRRAERRALTAEGKKKRLMQLSTSFEKYRDVLRRLHIPGIEAMDHVEHKEPVRTFHSIDPDVEQLLAGLRGKAIGIAPFAAHKGKILPVEKTERVIAMLLERQPGARVFLFGGGGEERTIMEQWQERWQGSVVAASPSLGGMRKELQLMSRLDVMLSMDSANMHLASLVGTRVVSVWGATHPCAGFLGWGQQEKDCVQLPLKCRPCSIFGNKPCRRGDFACMNEMDERMIVERIFMA